VPVFFHTGSAHGIHPSECSPLERYPRYYRSDGPTYRLTCRCSRRRSRGPAQQASVTGVQPFRESLTIGRGFSSPSAGYSPGFSPFQGLLSHALYQPSPELLPRASSCRMTYHPTRRRPGVSVSVWLAQSICSTLRYHIRIKQPS